MTEIEKEREEGKERERKKLSSTWKNSRLPKTEINSRDAAAGRKEFPAAELFSLRR